jgi:archaemetzincin
MRTFILIFLVVGLFTGCRKSAALCLRQKNQHKIIALQPLGDYDQLQLQMLQKELHAFFRADVHILKTIAIPNSFRIAKDEMYIADSIVQFLLKLKNDSIAQVVGLTHKEIHTLKESKGSNDNKGKPMAYWYRIRGLGYVSHEACIVSDYSMASTNAILWHTRLRNAVLHEIGHNLGLAHCNDESCLMSEKNGDIAVLSQSGRNFCEKCRQKVK